jgi:hypothetical protein
MLPRSPTDNVVLPTLVAVSAPTVCTTPTSFGAPLIQEGAFYTAEIDGYDRADLEAAAPSSRQLVDPQKNPVAPRWTTRCGPAVSPDASTPEPDASQSDASLPITPSDNPLVTPTQALLSTEVFLQGCLPLGLAPVTDASTAGPEASGEADAAAATDAGAPVQDDAPDEAVGDAGSLPDAADAGG